MARITSVFDEGHDRSYDKGQIILYQGETTLDVFRVKEGYIKVYDITASGAEKLMMILGEGDMFPLIWTFKRDEAIRYFYETYTDATVTAAPRKSLIEAIESNHELTKHLLHYFVDRTNDLMARVDCIEATSAKHKVAQVLLYLAQAHGDLVAKDTYKVRFAITHQSIADMAGLNRATASLQLKDFEDAKMYKNETDQLMVHSDRLEAFLETE